ncbi:DJ-1/PfpI family protein [Sorangium sp. So ce1097]|uniref:DJ-1/PfpI family protein n=1 Tax=Sorangium sp. So ce1097 TaxID=3133330 RepID=UPI003F5FD67F
MDTSVLFPGQRLEVGMVLYPGFTMQDLIGPQTVLSLHSNSHFIASTLDPVPSDGGGALVPSVTFADAPRDLDILFVPGGFGSNAAMQDREILAFLSDRAKTARFITSVCSGSLVLGAAGLLEGYRAATHWALYDALAALGGITPVRERVVTDRNRVTAGGVTAGVDFGLALLAQVRGEHLARLTQLMIEYDPAPPFDSGSPGRAGPELTARATALLDGLAAEAVRIARARHDERGRSSRLVAAVDTA